MSGLASTAEVQFGPGSRMTVRTSLRLTDSTRIYCHTYDDHPPILALSDGVADVSVTIPDRDQVTEQDIACARHMAEAVARYVAELESRMATSSDTGPAAEQAA